MDQKKRDYGIVDKFLDETHYQCHEGTHDFIANIYPTKLLDDVWNLIAYQGLTEDEAILKTEEILRENKEKWEGKTPYSGFVALEIAKNWIRDANSEQWSYSAKKTPEELEYFFQYAIEISVINTVMLEALVNKYRSNYDLIVGKVLCFSLHILNHDNEAKTKSPIIRKLFKCVAALGQSAEKKHHHLCKLAFNYYNSERNRFLTWVKKVYPTDYVNHEHGNQFSNLNLLIKNTYRNNASSIFIEAEWANASHDCQRQMLAGWVDRRQSALDIAKYHVIESEEDKAINRAEQVVENAEDMFERAQLYAEIVGAVAAGATGLGLPPIIRIRGKLYGRDIPPSVVLPEAKKWLEEATVELEELRLRHAKTNT